MEYEDYDILPQEEVALIQMHRAILIYLEGEDYISPITLAGAAEEIYAQMLKEDGKQSVYDEIKESSRKSQKELDWEASSNKEFNFMMNQTRNILKHRSADGHVGASFRMESMKMIHRAIKSYMKLYDKNTDLIKKYLEHEPYGGLTMIPIADSRLSK